MVKERTIISQIMENGFRNLTGTEIKMNPRIEHQFCLCKPLFSSTVYQVLVEDPYIHFKQHKQFMYHNWLTLIRALPLKI